MRSEVYFYEYEKDIPEGYQYDCENSEFYEYRNPYTGEVIHIAKEPPVYVKAIPIPDNATNGDMIKRLFPRSTIHVFDSLSSVNIITDDTLNAQTVDIEWWNAPYKVESELES